MKNYFPDMDGHELDTLKKKLWEKIRIVYFDEADELIDDDIEREKIISESKEDIVRICLIILVSYEYWKNQF